jgi:SAM-dependent methyltransferase
MVDRLFAGRPPTKTSRILDPGCGPGAFIEGIIRWCQHRDLPVPRITGVELDPSRYAEARERFARYSSISIVRADFLNQGRKSFDFVIGNPPYVPITSFTEDEKVAYRATYLSARGRFDLYLLFFEQALRVLVPGGRLVFITPEKFMYVQTAAPLRRILASLSVREIRLVDEATFGSLITYPTITTVDNAASEAPTTVLLRSGASREIHMPPDGSSLLPLLNKHVACVSALTLADVSLRVSCGVATGADRIFVRNTREIPDPLAPFARPTISGRQLVPGGPLDASHSSLLVPYDEAGDLMSLEHLGALGTYLQRPDIKRQLQQRTCVRRKPWYAFHDAVPLAEICRPKLLCKDITETPYFWIDSEGTIVPRHSVYYVVPKDPQHLRALAEYLNGSAAREWLKAHCQRAANNFLRLQSAILKRLPVPAELTESSINEERRRRVRRPRAVSLELPF